MRGAAVPSEDTRRRGGAVCDTALPWWRRASGDIRAARVTHIRSNKWCGCAEDVRLELVGRFRLLRGANAALQPLWEEDEPPGVICWLDWGQLSALSWAAVRMPGRYREWRRACNHNTSIFRALKAHLGGGLPVLFMRSRYGAIGMQMETRCSILFAP